MLGCGSAPIQCLPTYHLLVYPIACLFTQFSPNLLPLEMPAYPCYYSFTFCRPMYIPEFCPTAGMPDRNLGLLEQEEPWEGT